MAYNFYPYQPNFFANPQIAPNPNQPSANFVSVRSMEEAFNYPIAPGNSITFKDENAPFVYTKTKGFSPLENPVFEKYRLVKVEDTPKSAEPPTEQSDYQQQIEMLWAEVNALKRQIGGSDDKSADDSTVQTVHGKSRSASRKNGDTARDAE